jgi:hypothetical protein
MTTAASATLGFKYWPFDLVPRPGQPIIWADRAALKKDIHRLARRLGRHSAVSLHLLWADFGAGKTHALRYLQQEAEKGLYRSLLPLYSALPKGCRAFIDIYRAMVRGMQVDLLRHAYQHATKTSGRQNVDKELAGIWINLPQCFRAIAIGNDVQMRTALAWLHSEPGVALKDLHGLSILGRIRSTDEAVLALCGVVRLLNLGGHTRVLLMVDEFQRVEGLRRQEQDDVNAGLHSFFNSSGHGISLLLSFSFGVEENIKHFLNRELLSRVDPLRITIPMLSQADGIDFLNDVINQARQPTGSWPVTSDVVPAIVTVVAEKFDLTPRRLLKAAGLVFELAAMALEDEEITTLGKDYVSSMDTKEYFSRIDEQEEND